MRCEAWGVGRGLWGVRHGMLAFLSKYVFSSEHVFLLNRLKKFSAKTNRGAILFWRRPNTSGGLGAEPPSRKVLIRFTSLV